MLAMLSFSHLRDFERLTVRFVTRQLGPKRSTQTHQTQHDGDGTRP
jgi:hypothetical protein